MDKIGGAGAGMMFFAFFVLIMIVGGGLFWGVNAFFGKGYDFRQTEAGLMNMKIERCFSQNDFFLEGFNESFYEICGLNENVIEDGSHLILVRNIVGGEEVLWGVGDFENQCDFKGGKGNLDFPVCKKTELKKGGVDFVILTGSRQHSKKLGI